MTRRWITGVAALVGAALVGAVVPAIAIAPTAPDDFCGELDRASSAVRAGRVDQLPKATSHGFGFNFCGVQGPGYFCQQALAPPSLSLDLLSASIVACRPSLVRTTPKSRELATFEGDGVRIRITESGARGAHVGRIVSLVIEPK